MYKCTNCSWKGEETTRHSEQRLNHKCPVCGDEVFLLDDNEKKEVVELTEVNVKESNKKEVKKVNLENMTKDELNDYAAKKYPNNEIKYWWRKTTILNKIKSWGGE